ncbi:hypothetical protein KJ656_15660 [bacterium]|nr:hypothetical protein [bacterium]
MGTIKVIKPNPFNSSNTINFALKKDGLSLLLVYDLSGWKVARIVNRDMKTGYHQVFFFGYEFTAGCLYISSDIG